MEGVVVRYHWTLAEKQDAHRWHQRRAWFRRALFVLLLVLGAVTAGWGGWLYLVDGTFRRALPLLLPGGYCLLLAALFEVLPGLVLRFHHARSAGRDAEILWQITAAGLRFETANSVSESKWAAFNKAVQTPGGLLLYPQPRLFYWLPRHGFETEEGFEAVAAWAREHIEDFRVVRR